MGKAKNKNRQVLVVSILIIALVSIFIITQFDPTGKSYASGNNIDIVTVGGGDKVGTLLTNKAPTFEFDPTDLKKYQIPNRESDADYSFEWPLEEAGIMFEFKTKDKNCDLLYSPTASDAAGIEIPITTLIESSDTPYPWSLQFSKAYTYPISLNVTEEYRDHDCDGIPNKDDDDYTSIVIDNSNDNVQVQVQGQQGYTIVDITGNAGAGLNDLFDFETTTLKIYVYPPSTITIKPVIDIYLKEDPELELDSFPIEKTLVLDASQSKFNGKVFSNIIFTAEWTTPELTEVFSERISEPLKKEGNYSILGTKDISLTLKLKNFPEFVITASIN